MKKIVLFFLFLPLISTAQYIRAIQDTSALPTTQLWEGRFIRVNGKFYEYQRGGWYSGNVFAMYNKDSLGGEGCGTLPTTSQMLLVKNVPLRANLMNLTGVEGNSRELTDSSGNKTLAGSLKIGGGSTVLKFVYASLVYDCGSIAAGVDSTFSITCTGAVAGNPTSWGVSSAPEAGLLINSYCVTNDVVVIRLHNANLVSAIDPASRTYKVDIRNY